MSHLHASRRAVIGALASLPALAIPAGAIASTSPNLTAWNAAVIAMQRASAARETFYRDIMTPANRAHDAVTGKWPEPRPKGSATDNQARAVYEVLRKAEDRFNDFCCAYSDAVDDVIATPAPDTAALLAKIELAAAEDYSGGGMDGERAAALLSALAADVRRLGGVA